MPLGESLAWSDEDWDAFANDTSEETIEEARQSLQRHGSAEALAMFDAEELENPPADP